MITIANIKNTSSEVKKSISLVRLLVEIPARVQKQDAPVIEALRFHWNFIKGVANVAQIPAKTIEVIHEKRELSEAIRVSKELPDPKTDRKIFSFVKKIFEALSSYLGVVPVFFRKVKMLGPIQYCLELTSNMISAPYEYSDYCKSSDLEESSVGKVQEMASRSKNYYLLGLVKKVISVVCAILGFVLLANSLIVLLVLSWVGSVLGVIREHYKSQSPYPILSYDC